jgi:hypothetical protein
MIWYAMDRDGTTYTLGDYGDILAATEAALDYIDNEITKVWT